MVQNNKIICGVIVITVYSVTGDISIIYIFNKNKFVLMIFYITFFKDEN